MPIFHFKPRKKKGLSKKEKAKRIREFSDKFNDVAEKNKFNYDPEKDPLTRAFREKMNNWKDWR